MPSDACHKCGAPETLTRLENVPLCDRCANTRLAELTGYPELPDPPAPLMLQDADGRSRTLHFRVWRAPTGIVAEVEETGVPVGSGYQRSVLGSHDADVNELVARLCSVAGEEILRSYLVPNPHRPGWLVEDSLVEGRLVWCDGEEVGTPYNVVVDGRILSWEDFGRSLESYEGWRIRVELLDRVEDARPDAIVIPLSSP